MEQRWSTVSLGEKINVQTGYPFESERYTEKPEDIPLLRGANISQGRLDWGNEKRWPASGLSEVEEYLLDPGDVILAMDRPWIEAGLKFARTTSHHTPCLLVQRVARLTAEEDLDQTFLKYVIQHQRFTEYVKSIQTGSAVPHISAKQIRNYEFRCPPLPVQHRIADILGVLDDKIELNSRTNETLEEMAQALYRHWFVDFGPFQDREFKDTEALGPIPKGWDVKPIKEVVDMLGGSTPKTKVDEYWEDGNITWFTPTDLTDQDQLFLEHSDRQITEEGLNSCSTNLFPSCSIMMTSRATVGVTAINRVEACTNQGFINIIPGDEVSLPQVYFWIDRMMHKIEARADGSTYPEISQRDFKPLPILVAPSKDVEEYVRQSEELFSLIENNIVESETLAETRDYLLPKLISGEIEVEAAEQRVEDTV